MASRDLLLSGTVSRDASRHTGAAGLFWQNVTLANDNNTATSADCGGGTSVYSDFLKGDLGAAYRVTHFYIFSGTPNDFVDLEYWNGSSWVVIACTTSGLWGTGSGMRFDIDAGSVTAQLFEIKAAASGPSPGMLAGTWAIWGDNVAAGARTSFIG